MNSKRAEPKSNHSNNYIIKQSKQKLKGRLTKFIFKIKTNICRLQESIFKYRDRDRLKIKGW